MFARWLIGLTILAVSPSVALSAESRQLRVATFSCDVTPPLGGASADLDHAGRPRSRTPLLAKGIVLDDGQSAIRALCRGPGAACATRRICCSAARLPRQLAPMSRTWPCRCLHQHTAPYTDGDAQRLLDTTPNPPKYVDFEFLGDLTDRLAAAVRASLAQLQPFDEVGTGEAKVDRVASTRRVFMPDGKVHVRYSACKDPALRDMPEGNIDPMLKTVTLAKSGKPLVRIHYYATHPQTFYGDARVSADMPGFARERLEKKEGVFQIYFTGCAGNVTLGKLQRWLARRPRRVDRSALCGDGGLGGRHTFGPRRSADVERGLPLVASRPDRRPVFSRGIPERDGRSQEERGESEHPQLLAGGYGRRASVAVGTRGPWRSGRRAFFVCRARPAWSSSNTLRV